MAPHRFKPENRNYLLLVDFCTSGVLGLVELLKGLSSRALKLEPGISECSNSLDVVADSP
jgi:hypothetical protein